MEVAPPEERSILVAGVPLDSYLTRFEWNEAKYPPRRPLRELLDRIVEDVSKVDEELKQRVSEYQVLRSQLSGLARKAQGSLAVKDLATIFTHPESQLVETENLTSVAVCVPKYGQAEFLKRFAMDSRDFHTELIVDLM